MTQIHFVNRNKVLYREGVFLDIQKPGSPEVNDAKALKAPYNLPDSVILRTGAIVYQISQLYVVGSPPVIGMDDR